MQLPLSLTLLLLAVPALSSSGDRAPAFQSCLQHCTSTTCSPHNPARTALPLALRLTLWSCGDNCAYECMHALESLPQGSEKAKPQQYYGKWAFYRLLGAQEPLSVLASLANGQQHLRGLSFIRRQLAGFHGPVSLGLKSSLEWYTYVGMNAWLWSSVFHTRDTPWTERLDYFSAALALLYSLYYTLQRLFHLYLPSNTRWRHALAGTLALVFSAHVSYLTWLPRYIPSLPRFDYAYNMLFAVSVGLLHNALWLLARYTPLLPPPRPRPSYKPLAFVCLTMAAMSLELLDFPPLLGVLDAHALWHIATVPLVMFWYGWLVEDVRDLEEAARAGSGGGRVKL
ncbi:Per1-like protein [Calocera cornea HHB12733]|uniref:Post-GPI attachment to proteins factor 3 n=1 Tax=Calocera cornea HHB12733 TaxID=1353952 RepID=A0A165E171_9BASI|nr:Per1-like protein [Calocera cornea HHB12733]